MSYVHFQSISFYSTIYAAVKQKLAVIILVQRSIMQVTKETSSMCKQ